MPEPTSPTSTTAPASNVKGIDVHVHIATGDNLKSMQAGSAATETTSRASAARAYFGSAARMRVTADEVAEQYRALNLLAVVFDLDGELQTGRKMSNDDVADAVKRHPDVLIGFGSIDPNKGLAAIDEARRCVEVLGLKGFKLHPAIQRFAPNDERFYPLWDAISSLKVPALFHTGFSGIGTGMPGGDGIKLRYTQPLLLDDVAADFPHLTIIGAHPSWPWQEEMLAVARHKSNVFIDLSGWAPKYFPPSLVQQASTLLQDKCLFGTDFPLIPTERWLSEFAALPIKDEARPKIMVRNAARILGLDHLTG